ncbi:MAG: hypothetical protein ACRDSR_04545 [Pseudonocardiaceae bacterium]
MVIKSLVEKPLAVAFVAALPLVLVTGVVVLLALVSLLPARRLRTHTYRLIKLLTAYVTVLRDSGRLPPPAA